MSALLSDTATQTDVQFAKHPLTVPSPQLGLLRDSNTLLGNAAAMRARLADDGYLFIRGLHDRKLVLQARQQMLEKLAAAGSLDPDVPMMEGRIKPGSGSTFKGGANDLTSCPAYQELIRGPRCLEFYSHLRGGPAMTYDYQWLRVVGNGDCTGAHFDVVYMGRGTHNLLTMWTPLGDISYDMGPLALCVGSHRDASFAKVRETYGSMDVDRDRVAGWFSNDPMEIQSRFGGQWMTSEFEPGDALIFGMFTLHASLTNTSNKFRLSSDTRYQLASEPVDERWIGEKPKAHYGWNAGPQVSMEDKRKEWGV